MLDSFLWVWCLDLDIVTPCVSREYEKIRSLRMFKNSGTTDFCRFTSCYGSDLIPNP